MSNRFLASLSLVVLFPTLALHPGEAVGAQQLSTQVPDESDVGQSECSQPALEQNALIRDAETDKYTTRRVEFVGNKYTGDMVLRRRINTGLQEGDLFTRQGLIRSLRNVSKLKVIYPARLRDVVIQLDRPRKTVDMIICFREKRRPRRISQQGS
jgi:hypothetical protein